MSDQNTKLAGIELFYWLVKTREMTESRAVETMQNNNQDMSFVDDVREFLKSDAVIPVEEAWVLTKLVKSVEG
jgi:hypothetical protein